MQNKTSKLAIAGIVAAAYAALTLALTPISFGSVQFRVSEALCVLPFFFPETVWGLFVGCFIANLAGLGIGATGPWDLLIGPAATLLAAIATRHMKNRWLAPLPPVIFNGLMVGPMLALLFTARSTWLYTILLNILSVAFGELIVCYLLGIPLLFAIEKNAYLKQKIQKHK